MNVHLLSTPELPSHESNAVYKLLAGTPGPASFELGDYKPDENKFPFLKKYRDSFKFNVPRKQIKEFNPKMDAPLSWQELFSICDDYRQEKNLPDDDFVILLTRRKNGLNFFSCFDDDKRNAFIQTTDWELFTKTEMKYPVAYQVWANMLQLLMGMRLSTATLTEYIHFSPIGCLNDFCQNKKEIILKLRTADICDNCLEALKKRNVSNEIILQALGFFEEVRNQMLFSLGFTRGIIAYPIEVRGKKITVNNKELKLPPLAKALYLFYLKHPEGIRINELSDYRQELIDIYHKIRPGGDVNNIINVTKLVEGSFDYNKSRLNAKIKDHFGQRMAGFYTIEGKPGEKFKVGIDPSLIHFVE